MNNSLEIEDFQEVEPNVFKVKLNIFDVILNRHYSDVVIYDNGFIRGLIYNSATSPLSTKSKMMIKTHLTRFFNY